MKKIYSFLFAAVALMSAASCQKELVNDNAPVAEGEKFTITAVADAQTKTALASDGKNSEWTPGDAIAVFDASGNGAEFTTDITANQASAKFTCETFDAPESFVALYPYQAGLTLDEGTVTGLEFPAAQNALAGGFDKVAAFTLATGDDKDNLEFNNLYSLLKVTIAEEGITEVTVSATSGSLAGNVTLDSAEGTFTVVEGQGSSSVTLTGEFTKDATYYICVLPGEYEGFSIALNGYTVKTKGAAATFNDNEVYDLGSVARIPAPYSMIGTHNNWEFDILTPMYEKDGYYVAEDVTFTGSECKFKFIANDATDWSAKNYGSGTNCIAGNAYRIWSEGGDNLLTAGTYDIYFSTSEMFWYIVTSNSQVTDDTIKLASNEYGLVGNFNESGWSTSVPLYINGKYLAAKSLRFSNTTAEFKIRQFDNWTGESFGMSGDNSQDLNTDIRLNGSSNVKVTILDVNKKYDVYTDFVTIKLVESSSVEQ